MTRGFSRRKYSFLHSDGSRHSLESLQFRFFACNTTAQTQLCISHKVISIKSFPTRDWCAGLETELFMWAVPSWHLWNWSCTHSKLIWWNDQCRTSATNCVLQINSTYAGHLVSWASCLLSWMRRYHPTWRQVCGWHSQQRSNGSHRWAPEHIIRLRRLGQRRTVLQSSGTSNHDRGAGGVYVLPRPPPPPPHSLLLAISISKTNELDRRAN